MLGPKRPLAGFTRKVTFRFFLLIWCMACMIFSAFGSPAFAQTPVTMTGKLHVIHVDDFDPQRSHILHMLEHPQTHKMYPLYFQQPLADHEREHLRTGAIMTVRGTASGSSIILAAGGAANMSLVAPANPPGAVGPQKTIVLVANFRDTNVACSTTAVRDTLFTDPQGGSIDDLYQEASFGTVSFNGDVHGPYTINYFSTSPCDFSSWSAAAEAAAQASGVNLGQYDRRVYVLPEQNSCGYIGLGTIGGNPSRAWIFTCELDDVYGHELGHNLSAHHAATPTDEYGDVSDIMGYGGVGLRHLNAPHKEELGWLPATQLVTVTQSGVYRIAPLELSPADTIAPQVLKIAKPDTQEFYYFSYRRPLGFDAQLSATYRDRVNVHRYKGGSVQTYFLNSLPDGGSFDDPVNGVTVTQLRHDASAATVQVSLGCSPAAPALSLTPSSQTSKPGTTVQYTVSVTKSPRSHELTHMEERMSAQRSGANQPEAQPSSPYGYPYWDWVAHEDPEYVQARGPLSALSVGAGHALSITYREMVIIGILAFRGRQEGVVAHMRRAIAHGATKRALLEAIQSAAVPGGGPTFSTGVQALMQLDDEGAFKNG